MIDLSERIPHWAVVPGSLVLTVIIGLTDLLNGYEMSISILYLLPVSFATLAGGETYGFLTSLVCAGVWLAADLFSGHPYSFATIPYWNALVRLGYFSLHTLLLSALVRAIRPRQEMLGRDPLTGAHSWRHLAEPIVAEMSRARRANRPLTLCYFDLDNFKMVNDSLGHGTGDELLRAVTEAIHAVIRPSDVLARVGGDEFIVFLPEAGYEPAHAVLDRLSRQVEAELEHVTWPPEHPAADSASA